MGNKKSDKLQFNLDLDVSLETSLLWNFKNKIGGTGSFSDTEFCPLSAVMGGDLKIDPFVSSDVGQQL